MNWIKSNVSAHTGVPLSYQVPEESRNKIYSHIGSQTTSSGIIERIIVEEGISVYDAALWQIALVFHGGGGDLNKASHLCEIYWKGFLGELTSIRAGFTTGPNARQPFIYDKDQPELVSSVLGDYGRRGFLFRIFNAHGNYLTADPLDGKQTFKGFPTLDQIHWEDWKPIAGENAWVALAACQIVHRKHFDSKTGRHAVPDDCIELKLAEELARAAMILRASNGGIRMAPMGTFSNPQNIDYPAPIEVVEDEIDVWARKASAELAKVNPGDFDPATYRYVDLNSWHYNEMSTENNISWYSAFRSLHRITGKEIYAQAMLETERYLKSVWNKKEKYFYQGSHFVNGTWIANTDHFATDVQTWSIAKVGPDKIDAWFGQGTAAGIWESTKSLAGVRGESGRLLGVGFTAKDNRISIEWTAGAIFAARTLARHYAQANPELARKFLQDAADMRAGIEPYRLKVSVDQDSYSYSSRRDWIPFGWFSHDPQVRSMASTCWVVFVDSGQPPYRLPNEGSRLEPTPSK
jgi:hypothetical protein